MGGYANRVFAVVRRIPRGKVATYGQVARLIGAPRTARDDGNALHATPEPGTDPGCIPCHRAAPGLRLGSRTGRAPAAPLRHLRRAAPRLHKGTPRLGSHSFRGGRRCAHSPFGNGSPLAR